MHPIHEKNWEMINTVHGTSTSAIIYSISETAKANGLKPYEYFEYLLTEIPKHQDESSTDLLGDLLPWSENCRNTSENKRKPVNIDPAAKAAGYLSRYL